MDSLYDDAALALQLHYDINGSLDQRPTSSRTPPTAMPAAQNDSRSATPETGSMDNLTVFERYLRQREEALRKFHPQWDFTNEEIKASKTPLKRDTTPICIPPSWDLVQKYAGALEENAAGYDKDLYERGKRTLIGDRGEAEFLDLMRKLEIGGILIGDVNSQHFLYGHEFKIGPKEYFVLPNQIVEPLKKAKDFQFDFLYFNSQIGLIHIEVKKSEKDTMEKVFGYSYQIINQRRKLQEVFKIFCENIGEQNTQALWFEFFNAPSILMQMTDSKVGKITIKSKHCQSISNCVEFAQFLNKLRADRNRKKITTNFFEKNIFRQLIIFLIGYRPNFFISPVQCALQVHKNIFTHHINTVNYYSKNKEDILHITAKMTKNFLKDLKFVKNTNINFGKNSKIYLTTEQMDAIGKFDDKGNFYPQKQLIFGPAGSGKSLIAMIKIFILGQLKSKRKLVYSSTYGITLYSTPYDKILQKFVSDNQAAFCRKVEYYVNNAFDMIIEASIDFVFDEYGALPNIAVSEPGSEDQIYCVIVTGDYSAWISANSLPNPKVDLQRFSGIDIIDMRSIFRSTGQIQKFANQFKSDLDPSYFSVGHNYDGVKVECHIFPNNDQLEGALRDRLRKLLDIENCNSNDICVFSETHLDFFPKDFPSINYFRMFLPLRSMEFPVMVVINPVQEALYFYCTRAVCHLIIFGSPTMTTIESIEDRILKMATAGIRQAEKTICQSSKNIVDLPLD